VPVLAPVLEALKQLGRYTEAEINAAVISAMFTVFVQPATATDDRPFGEMLPENMLIDTEDQGSVELGNGAIVGLNPGETVSFADPKHPNAGYDKFTEAMIKQIGAALEIPPEVISKQFSTSYSAARGALNEFWRSCDVQRDDFVDSFCQPIYEEWLAEAVARNRIKAPGFFQDPAIRKAYSGCAWPGPARTSLNPVQEISAATKRVEAGFTTAQEETAQMTGGNYNRNIRQRVAEAKEKAGGGRDRGPVQRRERRRKWKCLNRFGSFRMWPEAERSCCCSGDISDSTWWGDEVTPKQFAEDLDKLGAVSEITVRINSGGGDVFAAQTIGNLLEQHPANVVARIDGLCASSATIVACHCDRVVAANDSTYMVHRSGWACWATTTPRPCSSI